MDRGLPSHLKFSEPLTPADIHKIAQRLAQSEAGELALKWVGELLNGPSLDGANQARVQVLLDAGWGSLARTTRDAIRDALNGKDGES